MITGPAAIHECGTGTVPGTTAETVAQTTPAIETMEVATTLSATPLTGIRTVTTPLCGMPHFAALANQWPVYFLFRAMSSCNDSFCELRVSFCVSRHDPRMTPRR